MRDILIRLEVGAILLVQALMIVSCSAEGKNAEAEYRALAAADVPMAEQCRAAARVSEAYGLDGDSENKTRWAERRDLVCLGAEACAAQVVGGC